jgi:hypothetical protein
MVEDREPPFSVGGLEFALMVLAGIENGYAHAAPATTVLTRLTGGFVFRGAVAAQQLG